MEKNEKKPLNYGNISVFTWLIALCACAYFLFNIFSYEVVTGALRYVAVGVGLVILVAALVFTVKKKDLGATFVNIVVAAAMCFTGFFIPSMQSQQENLFKEPAKTNVSYVNFYVLNDNNHSSDDLADYADAKYIVQTQFDTENEYSAVADASSVLDKQINTEEYDTILESLDALYGNKADVLILNQAFTAKIKTIDKYKNF